MKAVDNKAARPRSNRTQTKGATTQKVGRITPRTMRRMDALRNLDPADRKAIALVDVLSERWGISRAAVIPRIIEAVKKED